MTDTVNSNVIHSGSRRYVVELLNTSDGTGESAVVKVDASSLTGPDGTPPTHCVIEEITWSITSDGSVSLLFDNDTDDEAAELSGNGYIDFRAFGGLKDPESGSPTGDILLTTNSFASGDKYTILLAVRLKD